MATYGAIIIMTKFDGCYWNGTALGLGEETDKQIESNGLTAKIHKSTKDYLTSYEILFDPNDTICWSNQTIFRKLKESNNQDFLDK